MKVLEKEKWPLLSFHSAIAVLFKLREATVPRINLVIKRSIISFSYKEVPRHMHSYLSGSLTLFKVSYLSEIAAGERH